MFGLFEKSYSEKSLKLLTGKLIEMNQDSYWYFPDDVPSVQEIQLDGFGSLFGKKKEEKLTLAKQRNAFSCAVMVVMADKCFDGDDKDFKTYLEKGILNAFGSKHGKMVIKSFDDVSSFKDFSDYGREWALSKLD
ncbi:MAG: hypothetical protein CMD89_00500 [Gammaproteobacteria bacterium]|nr:hypothetical protein [Gammaproteobacteria bacterium]|tara:strand:+ start:1012 stop:1416 length:405 start_codon:yes stop_codon:yes gene_type:complete